jgi:hypothetical protein
MFELEDLSLLQGVLNLYRSGETELLWPEGGYTDGIHWSLEHQH